MRVAPLPYKPADGTSVHECGPMVLTKIDMTGIELFTDQGLVRWDQAVWWISASIANWWARARACEEAVHQPYRWCTRVGWPLCIGGRE